MTDLKEMYHKSYTNVEKDGSIHITSWAHEVWIDNTLEILEEINDKQELSLELIEEMIEKKDHNGYKAYNMDFMYYDFNYEFMTRDNYD
jgi:hypothetical protein